MYTGKDGPVALVVTFRTTKFPRSVFDFLVAAEFGVCGAFGTQVLATTIMQELSTHDELAILFCFV